MEFCLIMLPRSLNRGVVEIPWHGRAIDSLSVAVLSLCGLVAGEDPGGRVARTHLRFAQALIAEGLRLAFDPDATARKAELP